MKSENGQSLVEFALVLPLLVLLLFGIIDFGRIIHAYLTIDHAGREAARAASIGKTKVEVEQVAIDSGKSINLSDVTVSPGTSGANATVTITYPITFLTPVIGNIVGPITLEDTTVMRVE
jgi:Flp pilus assembly protein TadG